MAISEADIKRLWGKAAGICSSPGCNVNCLQFLDCDAPTVVGEMAHVIAKKESGPRGRPGGGGDTYSNLILLCPTHHTLVDRAPEGVFTTEMLLQWKQDHEGAIERSLASPLFLERESLDNFVQKLLIENRTCWATYGPESDEAKRNPNSSAGRIWQFRKLTFIVPNNRKIVKAIHANKHHFNPTEYLQACRFVEHAEGFETRCIKPVEGVPRFPTAFGELFDK
jgi:hypothetical protein